MSREGLSPWWIGGVLGGVILASIAAWYFLVQGAPSVEAPPQMVAGSSSTDEDSAAVPVTSPPPPPDLPPLDESDERVRQMALELSSHPRLVKWLAPDDLVRRMVATVDNLSRGTSPRPHLQQMRPQEPFRAEPGSDGALVIAPETHARYDLATEVFTSLDIGATVRLYYELEPLFEEAYSQLGHPSRSFAQALDEAVGQLIDTPIPEGELEVEKHLLVYRFADPRLEALTPAQKHLIRLGPENAQKVKSKLTFLRSALDLGRRSRSLLQREAAAEAAGQDAPGAAEEDEGDETGDPSQE